jgi:hypothetical protein
MQRLGAICAVRHGRRLWGHKTRTYESRLLSVFECVCTFVKVHTVIEFSRGVKFSLSRLRRSKGLGHSRKDTGEGTKD